MKINRFILFLLIFLTMGCEKINYQVDNPIAGLPTRVLMHRGNGSNTDFVENTLDAAKYGLSVLDGIELDIQMSKDGTLWLDHDNEVHDCSGAVIGCFSELTDKQIIDAAECNDTVRYHTLESVFQLMAADYPDSYISLDIKGQYCNILSSPDIMRQMGRSVIDLVTKYHMEYRVLVESNSIAFLSVLKDQDVVGQCVICMGDIDKGMADANYTGARGISLKYGKEELNADVVSLIHRTGYGLVVWVINEPTDIDAAWRAHPDFIQTDNPDFKKYIPKEKY